MGLHQFGVCFVDSSTGHFFVAHINDDEQHSQFETLIVQIKPKELVYAKGMLSPLSLNIIKRHVASPIFNVLKEGSEFWDADTTKERIDAEGYFNGTVCPLCYHVLTIAHRRLARCFYHCYRKSDCDVCCWWMHSLLTTSMLIVSIAWFY